METTKKLTVQEVVKRIKGVGAVISNVDLPMIINYLNEYEPTLKIEIVYNDVIGKSIITTL